jgi:hypothetical protein
MDIGDGMISPPCGRASVKGDWWMMEIEKGKIR